MAACDDCRDAHTAVVRREPEEPEQPTGTAA
ncbi:AhpD family alkylhydroperoxidase [Geodermatophilus sabuli]|nr:AhpD family alkylhydroperoxidase [Geodermatophilus sabuli]